MGDKMKTLTEKEVEYIVCYVIGREIYTPTRRLR